MTGATRHGVELKHLDAELFDGAGATKADLVDYVDALADRLLPELRDRPLTVVRVRPGQQPFMQKNLPGYAPSWIPTVGVWSHAGQREIRYPLCHDVRTLVWFAGQRAVELHPTVADVHGHVDRLVLDLDPPAGAPFRQVVDAARAVRQALRDAGLDGAVKTSGSKGLHVVVPVEQTSPEDVAAATRALAVRAARLAPEVATTSFLLDDRDGRVFVDPTRAGGASLACAYSPRARPGVPVSFPLAWDDLDAVEPRDVTIRSVPGLVDGPDLWAAALRRPSGLPADLVAEGHAIAPPRVVAMHEGRRRARAARPPDGPDGG
jgi:DNA ligase D-like protein (predicted polymerase)